MKEFREFIAEKRTKNGEVNVSAWAVKMNNAMDRLYDDFQDGYTELVDHIGHMLVNGFKDVNHM